MKNKLFLLSFAFVVIMAFVGCQPIVTPPVDDPTYTVTYNLNGYTGTTPVDSAVYKTGDVVTVAATASGTEGWSLSTSGSMVTSFTMGSSNVVLYAQWKDDDTSVTFSNVNDFGVTSNIYRWNGTGSYYTVNGDVSVTKTAFYATIGSTIFVNDMYREVGLASDYYLTAGGLPANRYFERVSDGRHFWLCEKDGKIVIDGSLDGTTYGDGQPFTTAIFDWTFHN